MDVTSFLPTIVKVSNVSSFATLEKMKKLFSYLGELQDIKMYPSEDNIFHSEYRVCYVKYAHPWSVNVSVHLTNTVFFDRALIVTPIHNSSIPNEEKVISDFLNPAPALPGLGTLGGSCDLINNIAAINGQLMISTVDPKLSVLSLTQYPPLPASLDPKVIEEIRRTVYIGNLNPNVKTDDLLHFLNQIVGEVKYVRMAGDDSHATRFAFVEFTDRTSIIKALQSDGVHFEGKQLKINHSNTAIVKPVKAKVAAGKEIKEAMKRVKAAEDLITATVEPEISKSRQKHKRRSRSRSRSRFRHRRRSPTHTSRSRTTSHRSKHRSLSKESLNQSVPEKTSSCDQRSDHSKSPHRSPHHSSSDTRKSSHCSPSVSQKSSHRKPSTYRRSSHRSPSTSRRSKRSRSTSRRSSHHSPSTSQRSRRYSPSTSRRSSHCSPSISRKSSHHSPSTSRKSSHRSPYTARRSSRTSHSQRSSHRSKSPRRSSHHSPSASRRSDNKSPSASRRSGDKKSPSASRRSDKSPSASQRSGDKSPSASQRSSNNSPSASQKSSHNSPSASQKSSHNSPSASQKSRSRSRSVSSHEHQRSGSASSSQKHSETPNLISKGAEERDTNFSNEVKAESTLDAQYLVSKDDNGSFTEGHDLNFSSITEKTFETDLAHDIQKGTTQLMDSKLISFSHEETFNQNLACLHFDTLPKEHSDNQNMLEENKSVDTIQTSLINSSLEVDATNINDNLCSKSVPNFESLQSPKHSIASSLKEDKSSNEVAAKKSPSKILGSEKKKSSIKRSSSRHRLRSYRRRSRSRSRSRSSSKRNQRNRHHSRSRRSHSSSINPSHSKSSRHRRRSATRRRSRSQNSRSRSKSIRSRSKNKRFSGRSRSRSKRLSSQRYRSKSTSSSTSSV